MEYIQEEYILQSFVLIGFVSLLLVALITELNEKRKKIDEFTYYKMKKIFKYVYLNVFDRDKEKTVAFMKEIKRNNLINEKYDLIKKEA